MNQTPTPPFSDTREIKKLRRKLLSWYRANKRDMPWRRRPTLYYTVVSEFMLQQTRVDQALPYFKRFVRIFPSMKKLSEAPQQEVLKAWEGLGYYSRARNLQKTVQALAGQRKVTVETLAECPGIGPYTLAAISSIVLKEPLPVVDGNVNRVLARLLALEALPTSKMGKQTIMKHLSSWIDSNVPGDWNQAMMELGATVCTPRQPTCKRCPLKVWCRTSQTGEQDLFPRRSEKAPRPHRHWTAALLIRKDGRVLIAQRPAKGLLASLWEFPGGEATSSRNLQRACEEHLAKNLGLIIKTGKKIASIPHGFSHFTIQLHAFEARVIKGRLSSTRYQAYKWIPRGELAKHAFPRAHWPILEHLGVRLNDRNR